MKHITGFDFENIYRNCVYSMSIHIASCVRLPYIQFEKNWENNLFSIQDYAGTEGTIYFDRAHRVVVGAFRNLQSDRMRLYPDYDAISLFNSATPESISIAQTQVFDYLLTSVRKKSFFGHKIITLPIVTTCIWSEHDDIYSCDNITAFVKNGGNFVYDFSGTFDSIKMRLLEYYEPTLSEIECAMLLYKAKLSDQPQISKHATEDLNSTYATCSEFWEAVEAFGITII